MNHSGGVDTAAGKRPPKWRSSHKQEFRLRYGVFGALALAGFVMLSGAPALAAGDAAAGKTIFNQKCAICHSPEKGVNKIGPSLFDVVGRKAGSLSDYTYSDAMKNANRTWDAATLDDYLTDPRGKIPGIKMIFAGLPKASQRQDVIAYLSTLK
jgi:cytochrome c